MLEVGLEEPIPLDQRVYFQERLRYNLYAFVLEKFLKHERERGLTRAKLARRIGKKPEVISRILASPGNWTTDTVSDLLLGIAAEELVPSSESVLGRPQRNFTSQDLLDSPATSSGSSMQVLSTSFNAELTGASDATRSVLWLTPA